MHKAYLDYNATAPIWPEVIDSMSIAMKSTGNASSVHTYGRNARGMVEQARESIAELVGADPSQIVFTGSGTEANNLALGQFEYNQILVSAIEHDSVLRVSSSPLIIPVSSKGVIQIDKARNVLSKVSGQAIISMMLANNETGVLQPVGIISSIARSMGIQSHCDAVQAIGKIDVDFRSLGVNMMTISSHKLGGPQGVGALIINQNQDIKPIIFGGGQERGRRAGTENVAGIVGFGVAAEVILEKRVQLERVRNLRNTLEEGLRSIDPDVNIFGFEAERLPNTTCVSMRGVDASIQIAAMDLKGVMVSAGSACSSGKIATSHVLTEMSVPKEDASTAIRVSLGWDSLVEDVEQFLNVWRELFLRKRNDDHVRASAA